MLKSKQVLTILLVGLTCAAYGSNTLQNVTISSSTSINEVPSQPWQNILRENSGVTSTCLSYRNKLAELVGVVSNCFVSHSQPFAACQHCATPYLHFHGMYHFLKDSHNVTAADGVNCLHRLSSLDQIQLLPHYLSAVHLSWSASNCDSCYVNLPEKGISPHCNETLDLHYTNKTGHFFHLQYQVLTCLNAFLNGSSLEHFNAIDTPMNVQVVNSTACHDCGNIYNEINRLYEDIRRETHDKVCQDVVDAMNFTRHVWFYMFGCKITRSDSIDPLLPLLVGLLCCGALYLSAVCCWRRPMRVEIYRQRRVTPSNYDDSMHTLARSRATSRRHSEVLSYGSMDASSSGFHGAFADLPRPCVRQSLNHETT